jgi:hypothetical protein
MNQFYIVNSTSKSVRTDLALSLLKKRVDEDPTLREELQKRGREWQVDGQTLVERLTNESPVWRDRIRFPDGKGHNLNYVGIDGRITEASTEFSIFWRT